MFLLNKNFDRRGVIWWNTDSVTGIELMEDIQTSKLVNKWEITYFYEIQCNAAGWVEMCRNPVKYWHSSRSWTYSHKFSHLTKLVLFYFYFYYSFIHMCIHCLGHITPLPPSPILSPSTSHFQAEPVLPLSQILLKKRHKHNKEDKVFLLVKDSYTERFLALLSCTHVLQPMLIHL
jgi:hypothetical protein